MGSSVDLLADVLDSEPTARQVIRSLLEPGGRTLRSAEFNVHEVEVDHDAQELKVWDILDRDRPPFVVAVADAWRRLDQPRQVGWSRVLLWLSWGLLAMVAVGVPVFVVAFIVVNGGLE